MKKFILYLFLIPFFLCHTSCLKDKADPGYADYPEEIGKIMITKCAVPGCHNNVSKGACAGLDLSTWDKMFEGSNANSAVIPYRPDYSFLFYAINTFDDLGLKLLPTMPVNADHLSRHEVITMRDWIASGAPDKDGTVKWSENPMRRKIYVVNQGCDLLTVFDAASGLIIRCVDVGNTQGTEAPHDMYVSPDGKFLYISFFASGIIQKYRTTDEVKVGELNLTDFSWHSMSISGDSKTCLVSHLDADGKVALLDLENMKVIIKYQGSGLFVFPHGNTMNEDGTLAYVTCQQGNFIYKVEMTNQFAPEITEIPLQPGIMPSTNGIYKPYDVEFSPDYSKYYVTCQGTNELRIFHAANDSLMQVIPTSGVPQVMAFSLKKPYVFVPCMEDSANHNTISSVNIISLTTNQLLASVQTGPQPRSVVVDDENDLVWVANRNISGTGWAPHHTTVCQGRNGYITTIDLNTLQPVAGWKAEVSVDPYHLTIRK